MKGEPVRLLGRGRPPDTARTRGLKKLLRASHWRAIRRGELAPELDTEGVAPYVDRTRRDDVDNATAEIMGKGHRVRSIQEARQRQPITDPDEWGALTAALRWLNRKRG